MFVEEIVGADGVGRVEIRHVSSNGRGMHEQSQPTCVSKKKHLTGP